MRSAKRIVIVGGFAESLVNFRGPLIRAMAQAGHSVTACAPDASPALRAALAELGADYRDVPIDRAGLNPLRDARTVGALVRLFRGLRPDAVLSYTIKPVIYGSLAARWAGVPAVFSMITGLGFAFQGETAAQRALGRLVRAPYRWSLAGNRAVFFQNPDDWALFRRLRILRRAEQAVLINGSGVDVERFRPAPLPERPAFLLIARLLKAKGVREYVEAARAVKRAHPEVPFHLVGWIDPTPDAIREEELRGWTAEGVVEYAGRVDDVRPELAKASVYVLPSYAEGTPRTVLEAMAMGRAVITTDAPGCRETVRDGWNGLLVPPRNAAALSAAMEKLLGDQALVAEMGRRSRELAVERYDVRKVNAVILQAMGLA